ncbi:hypothetical protein NQZ68_042340 [Dissostichus eleginoides]|nr:hypothetical protein NQZ68_042340 [Dissostichus eleginoides]
MFTLLIITSGGRNYNDGSTGRELLGKKLHCGTTGSELMGRRSVPLTHGSFNDRTGTVRGDPPHSMLAERDRIQRQVEELEQSLSATNADLQLMSSETDESDAEDSEEEGRQSAADLLAERERIQQEIQNLENVLGEQSPECETEHETQEDGSPRTGGLQSGGRFTEDRRPAVRRTVHRGQEACSQEDRRL